MMTLLGILLLSVCTWQLQVVVEYTTEPYAALRAALGKAAIENSDACDDKFIHITNVKDPILNRNVHLYSLHVDKSYQDGDRCLGDYSRQRCETSVQQSSPAWMHGSAGKTFTYAWKLYLDSGFKASGAFCHLHQIKLDGSGVGNPNLTLTARTSVVELYNDAEVIAKVPLTSFKGVWIQIREKITYGANGYVDFTAHRMKDGYLLMNYKGNVKLNNNGIMIRPKFGFYRSLADKTSLQSQSVRITDLCVGENDSCHYDQNGNRYSPAPASLVKE